VQDVGAVAPLVNHFDEPANLALHSHEAIAGRFEFGWV
jgi:hypothetical protein